jgi:hypothetical protein
MYGTHTLAFQRILVRCENYFINFHTLLIRNSVTGPKGTWGWVSCYKGFEHNMCQLIALACHYRSPVYFKHKLENHHASLETSIRNRLI